MEAREKNLKKERVSLQPASNFLLLPFYVARTNASPEAQAHDRQEYLDRYCSLVMLPSTTAAMSDFSHSERLMAPSLHTHIQIHTSVTPWESIETS